jgi:hypothetical protein
LLLLGSISTFLEGGRVGGCIFGLVGTVNLGGKGVEGAVIGSRKAPISDQSSTLLLFTKSDLDIELIMVADEKIRKNLIILGI